MNCTSCSSLIVVVRNKIDGVMKANVSFKNKEAIIWYDASKIQVEKFEEIIEKTKQGKFKAKIIEDNSGEIFLPETENEIKEDEIVVKRLLKIFLM